MGTFDRKKHWENVYKTKNLTEVSWYQEVPTTSLEVIEDLSLTENSRIIDIGGGDSLLVDNLISLGFKNISVLDISARAIEKAKNRLGSNANGIKWIVSDAVGFQAEEKYCALQ